MNASDLDSWFVREVLPLESALTQFLRRSWRNRSDVDDLCQEVYVRVYEAAQKEIPDPVRPFVFAVARNLIINRVRREQIVPIESLGDLDALNIAWSGAMLQAGMGHSDYKQMGKRLIAVTKLIMRDAP